ncbi:unnamed protein product [Closterium sp. NIES-54]
MSKARGYRRGQMRRRRDCGGIEDVRQLLKLQRHGQQEQARRVATGAAGPEYRRFGGVSSIGADVVEGPAIGVDVAVAAAAVVSAAADVVSAAADVVFAAADVVSAAAGVGSAAAEC